MATATPTGNVTVSDGTTSCTATVAAGQCALAFASTGARSLTASYAGDSTFAASTSAAEPHTVNRANTTTTISADTPDSSVTGQAVTVHYDVAPSAPGDRHADRQRHRQRRQRLLHGHRRRRRLHAHLHECRHQAA